MLFITNYFLLTQLIVDVAAAVDLQTFLWMKCEKKLHVVKILAARWTRRHNFTEITFFFLNEYVYLAWTILYMYSYISLLNFCASTFFAYLFFFRASRTRAPFWMKYIFIYFWCYYFIFIYLSIWILELLFLFTVCLFSNL